MSKLRAIKERRNDDPSFEQDLRGLGGTDLLANEYPWVFLTVRGEPKMLQDICTLLNLHFKHGKLSNYFHLYKTGQHENHKEKTLQLFGAAALLSHHNPELPLLIGQLSILAERIKGTDSRDLSEESSEDYNNWNQSVGLFIPEHIRIYLSHAGINIKSEILQHGELSSIIKNHNADKLTNLIKVSKVG